MQELCVNGRFENAVRRNLGAQKDEFTFVELNMFISFSESI